MLVLLLAHVADGAQIGDPITCPDGEQVRPIEKVRVCKEPFELWERSIRLSIRGEHAGGELGVQTAVDQLAGEAVKALRTQAALLCQGMMTAPCTLKDEYGSMVRELPGLVGMLEGARHEEDRLAALRALEARLDLRREAAVREPVSDCVDRMVVVDAARPSEAHALPAGSWRIRVTADGGGIGGEGVVLAWDRLHCRTDDAVLVIGQHTGAARYHALTCVAPAGGDALRVVTPQGGLLDGSPGRATVAMSVCPAP